MTIDDHIIFFFFIIFFLDIFFIDIFFFIGFFAIVSLAIGASAAGAVTVGSGAGAVWATATPKLRTDAAQASAMVFRTEFMMNSLKLSAAQKSGK